MLQNIKPLLAVLLVLGCVHWATRRYVLPGILSEQTQKDLTIGWAVITLLLFLSPSFWVFLPCSAALAWWLGQKHHPVIVFCGLIYAAPNFEKMLLGLGPINALASFSYQRVLAVTVLMLWLTKWKPKKVETAPLPPRIFDHLILMLGLYRVFLQLPDDTVTNTLRDYSNYLIDVTLVYWIGRRWVASPHLTKEALAAYTYGIMIVCGIAAFEFLKRWILYKGLVQSLDVPGSGGGYLLRGDTGLLRTFATTGQPIPLGYLAMVGIMVWLALTELHRSSVQTRTLGLGLLAMGSIASLARGPWLALAAALVLWFSISPDGLKRLFKAGLVLSALFAVALVSPAGDKIVSMMPWASDVEDFNIVYRQRLIEVTMMLVRENPWFGSSTFMSAPVMEQLIQGEGIVDLVNTYLALALSTGVIGAGLFTLLIIGPLLYGAPLYLKLLATSKPDDTAKKADPLFRSMLTLSLGTAITIGTVSSITVIPWTYWLLAGITVGMIQHHQSELRRRPTAAHHGPH